MVTVHCCVKLLSYCQKHSTHRSLSALTASSSSYPSCSPSSVCSLALTRRSQSSSCSGGRGRLYSGCLNSASSLERPFTSCAALPPPVNFFSLPLKESSPAGRELWTFLWGRSASRGLGWDPCCKGSVSWVEEDGGRMHAVWRMERQKKARRRWRARDRQARLR